VDEAKWQCARGPRRLRSVGRPDGSAGKRLDGGGDAPTALSVGELAPSW